MLVQELRTAIGFKQQSDLQTPLVAADCWSLRQTNTDVPIPQPVNENDANDIGKGIWPTQNFKSHWNVEFPWNGRLTSERAAQVLGFALGKRSAKAAASTGWKYTFVPLDPDAGDDNLLPTTTFVSAGRQGVNAVFDTAMIGCAISQFTLSLNQGVGRDTAMLNATFKGSGKHAEPSTITIPTFTTEHELNIGGASIVIHGTNYMTESRFVSAEFSWNNNILVNTGYIAGSGEQNGYAIMNRMRRGTPVANLSFQVEAVKDGNERADVLAQTEGAAVITIEGATIGGAEKHKLVLTYPRVLFDTVTPGDNEGTMTWNVSASVLKHAVNPYMTAEVWTTKDDILTAAA